MSDVALHQRITDGQPHGHAHGILFRRLTHPLGILLCVSRAVDLRRRGERPPGKGLKCRAV